MLERIKLNERAIIALSHGQSIGEDGTISSVLPPLLVVYYYIPI